MENEKKVAGVTCVDDNQYHGRLIKDIIRERKEKKEAEAKIKKMASVTCVDNEFHGRLIKDIIREKKEKKEAEFKAKVVEKKAKDLNILKKENKDKKVDLINGENKKGKEQVNFLKSDKLLKSNLDDNKDLETKNNKGKFIGKLTDNKLFRIEEYKYRVIEVQVDSRMKDANRNYTDLANIIHSMMKDIRKRVVFDKDGIVYRKCQPISFEILYNSNKEISFNFAVNELDSLYFKNRLEAILPNSTVVFRDDYIDDFVGSPVYNYKYNKHYMLSLNTKVSPIQSLLAVKKDLKNDEKMLLQTLIQPLGEDWKADCEDNWKKVRKGQDVTKGKDFIGALFEQANGLVDWCCGLLDEILEVKVTQEVSLTRVENKLIDQFKSESRTKHNSDGFLVDINAYIKTTDYLQDVSLSKSIETCYKDLTLDNELMVGQRKIANDVNRKIKWGFAKTIFSTLELANFVKLPDNSLQRKFNVKSIRINQIDPPAECLNGLVKIGELNLRGKDVEIFIPKSRDIGCLPIMVLTKMGGGKTTLLLRIASEAVNAGEGLVLFDYIRDCQTAKALQKMFPDINVIKFDDLMDIDNFSFPEVDIDESADPSQRKLQANIIATEIKYLLNSMAVDIEPMSRIMSRYLNAACKVVFVHKDKTLLDLLDVLENKDIRDLYIDLAISQGIFTDVSREIVTLQDLDTDKGQSRVMGLLDRFSVITEDTILNTMLESPKSRINFVDIMDNQKPTVIVMPQNIFTNKYSKDVLCTYYLSRIRLAMSRRKDFNKICRVIIDEAHQIPRSIDLIKDTIAEPRKFGLSYIMTMHSFSQLRKEVKEVFLSVGCHFMLLKGVDEHAFNELKSYIGEEFDFSDMADMSWKFGSLNLFSVNNKYNAFMAKLPEPLKDKDGKFFIGD